MIYMNINMMRSVLKMLKQLIVVILAALILLGIAGCSFERVTLKGIDYNISKKLSLFADGFDDSDISPLKRIVNLQELTIIKSNITDLGVFARMTKLKKLNLNENRISDLTPLASLTNLTHLSLGFGSIEDISILAELTKLTYLDLSGNYISDVSVLIQLKNLKYLYIRDNPLTDEQIAELRTALPKTEIVADY